MLDVPTIAAVDYWRGREEYAERKRIEIEQRSPKFQRRKRITERTAAVMSAYPLQPGQPVPAQMIVSLVCAQYDIDEIQQGKKYRRPRAIISALLRKLTRMSYPEITPFIGTHYHSTAMKAARVGETKLADETARICRMIEAAAKSTETC
jgi:chromosomal replication initiation ATPase DnaA